MRAIVCSAGSVPKPQTVSRHRGSRDLPVASIYYATLFISRPRRAPLAAKTARDNARMTARIAATRAPYAVRLALTVLAFVACVTAASLLCFEACRAPCRAWVGVGCLRA